MGRGKQWNDDETKALIEAFIHISEDAMIGTNQSGDQLYLRVMEDAKKRYAGEWMRSPEACKKRWLEVSKEVQKFCAAMKFVESVEHSGWNDHDYFKAAEEYYCAQNNDSSGKFKFVDEWKFLKGFEKWKTCTSTEKISKLTSKRSYESKSSSEGSDCDSYPQNCRPIGNKKQKAMAAIESKADEWFKKLATSTINNESNDAMLKMMKENLEEAKKNRDFLNEVLSSQTEKLTLQMKKSAALKALAKIDLSTMSASFQEKAKKKLEEEISSVLNF